MCDVINGADKVAIAAHAHPDGDAIGSCVALLHYLRGKGVHPSIVLYDRWPDSLSFIAAGAKDAMTVYESEPEKAAAIIEGSDAIFCLDMNSFGRAEALGDALGKAACPKVLIDHHLNPETDRFSTVFSMTEISSTSELLYYVLLAMPDVGGDAGNIPAEARNALMAGMTTDTNNFANSVYPSTFSMASVLIAAGVDRDAIIESLYGCYRENRLRLMGTMLKDRMTITAEGAAYMIIDKPLAAEFDIRDGETEGFVNMPLGIRDVKMSLLLREEDDRYRVSIRSRRGISANLCAKTYFNGGGHELAAGGKLVKGKDISGGTAGLAAYVESVTGEFLAGGRKENNGFQGNH